MGSACTSHTPINSRGSLSQTKTFSTAQVPPAARRTTGTSAIQRQGVFRLPAPAGFGLPAFIFSSFSLASFEDSFMMFVTRPLGEFLKERLIHARTNPGTEQVAHCMRRQSANKLNDCLERVIGTSH
jgi:hypothetical protein